MRIGQSLRVTPELSFLRQCHQICWSASRATNAHGSSVHASALLPPVVILRLATRSTTGLAQDLRRGGQLSLERVLSCSMLWRPEALDCWVLVPRKAWTGSTRNPPSLGFETPDLLHLTSDTLATEPSGPLLFCCSVAHCLRICWLFFAPLDAQRKHHADHQLGVDDPVVVAVQERHKVLLVHLGVWGGLLLNAFPGPSRPYLWVGSGERTNVRFVRISGTGDGVRPTRRGRIPPGKRNVSGFLDPEGSRFIGMLRDLSRGPLTKNR